MKIVVLAGGYSPEREVSLTSGSLIANSLMKSGHRVCLLDVYEGLSPLPDSLDTLFHTDGQFSHTIGESIPDLATLRLRCGDQDALIGANVLRICAYADLVFLALHGAMGENGQLQATLDNYGIRYTGTGYIGSLLAMDKDIAKRLLRAAGIRTPDWLYLRAGEDTAQASLSQIGFPCIVKPASCGSSVGVTIVETEESLAAALTNAAEWDTGILIEQKIEGREITVGILDGMTLPPVEIIPQEGFYNYRNKYQGLTEELCPAPISSAATEDAYAISLRAFSALRLCGYARFDYILDKEDRLWCLEANTLPGMTPTSLFPQAASAVGIDYDQLCERIVAAALKKH